MSLPRISDTISQDAARRMRQWEERARRDAMKHIARGIPCPVEFARSLPLVLADALVKARRSPTNEYFVHREHAAILKPMGLVDAGTGKTCLGAFGIKVRKALLEMDA